MRSPRLTAAVLATVTVLAVTGCSSSATSAPAPTPAPTPAAATPAPATPAPSEAAVTPAPATPTASPIRLAAVLPNTSDPFWQTIVCGAQAEAAAQGVDLKMFTSTGTDANVIAQNFQSAMLTNPQGAFIDPFNNNQFLTQYKDLMAKGVPVVTGNGTSPATEYKNIYSGSDTAQFVAQVSSLIPSGPGTMVYMGGAPGIPPLETRTMPFVNEMKKVRSDLKPLDTEYSGFDINKATTDASALILAHPDLKLIIAADGPDGAAAAAALKQSGKVGKIALVAFDAVPPEVAALKEGTITVLIAQNPGAIGHESIKALVDYLKAHPEGGPVTPAGEMTISSGLLTKDNVDDPANADLVYKTSC